VSSARQRVLSPQLLLLMLAGALGTFAYGMALPVLPLTVTAATHDQATAGLVTGVVSALTITMELLSPNILRRFRVRDVLVASALVQLVAMAGFAAVRTLPAMLAWGALTGAGFGLFVTVVVVAVAALVPPGRTGEAIGYFGLGVAAPTILGPPLAFALLDARGAGAVFAAGALACAAGGAISGFLRLPATRPAAAGSGGVVAAVRSPGVAPVLIALGCTTLTYGAAISFTPLLLGTSGPASAAVFLPVFAVARMLARTAAGRAVDRVGEPRLAVPSLAVGAGAFALLQVHAAPAIVVSAAVSGAAFGVVQTAAFVGMLHQAGPDRSAGVSGIWSVAIDGGIGGGALLMGPAAAALGLAGAFWLLPALFALAFVVRLPTAAAGLPTMRWFPEGGFRRAVMDVQVAERNGLAPGTLELRSVGPLAFGPDGVLFAADNVSASVFAIALDDDAPGEAGGPIDIDQLDTRLAALLGCARDDVVVRDLAVHPVSRAAYLSVMRGHGADAVPLLVRAGQDGSLAEVSLSGVPFARAAIENAPGEDDERQVLRLAEGAEPFEEFEVRGIKLRIARDRMRSVTVTDLAYADGTLLVAGASNEEFVSCLRRIPFPFGGAARSNSLEIFHVSHGKYETEAPVRTLVPYGSGDVLASYTCTPVVHFSLAEAEPGAHVMGRTVAELGAMNTPLDMVSYRHDGQEYLLVANNRHPLFKLACADIEGQAGLTDQQSGFGVPRQDVPLDGVVRMAVRGDGEVLMLRRDGDGHLHLRSHATDGF